MICKIAYYIKGLPSTKAMQAFYVGSKHIYVLQGQETVTISRCKIEGNVASYLDHMSIVGNGHCQTLDYYKGFFFIFTKPTAIKTSKKWAIQPAKFKYEADKTYKYTDLARVTNCIDYRADGCLSGNVAVILRKHLAGQWMLRIYKTATLFDEMDKHKKLNAVSMLSKDKTFKAQNLPYKTSVQGCAYINGLLYLVGGGIGNKPQLCILKQSSSTYNLYKRITFEHSNFGKNTEVENIQIKGNHRYFGVNDKSNDCPNIIYEF